MRHLKKLSRSNLKNITGNGGPDDPTTGIDELVKCGTTWCDKNFACCYHRAGFYYCDQAGYCTSN